MEDGIEMKLLEELGKRLLMQRWEIVEFLKDKVDKPMLVLDALTKDLNSKGLITFIPTVGSIAITKKGIRKIEYG